jgi:hypothetical protein
VQTCIATIYICITYILYFDNMLPLLVATGCDSAILIACIVVASTVGKPLSYLSCPALSSSGNTAGLLASLGQNAQNALRGADPYYVWAGTDQKTCYAIKAVWGLSIALCVLFAFSAVICVCLWRRLKMMAAPVKDVEG